MPKSDKELAVEFASTYVSTWFSREGPLRSMDSKMIHDLIKEAYDAIHSLPAKEDI